MRSLVIALLFIASAALGHAPAKSTEIVLVVDRSGSMASVLKDAEGGINTFLEGQRKLEGDVRLTLVQFDDRYEVLHSRAEIDEVGDYHLVPGGNTALLDAVGRAIEEVRDSHARLRVLAIVTDGQENSSRERKLSEIQGEIAELIEDGWQVVYIGKNVDAFAEAGALSISSGLTLDADGSSFTASATVLTSGIADANAVGSSEITLTPCDNCTTND